MLHRRRWAQTVRQITWASTKREQNCHTVTPVEVALMNIRKVGTSRTVSSSGSSERRADAGPRPRGSPKVRQASIRLDVFRLPSKGAASCESPTPQDAPGQPGRDRRVGTSRLSGDTRFQTYIGDEKCLPRAEPARISPDRPAGT